MTQHHTTVVVRDPQTHECENEKYTDYEIYVETTDIAFSKAESIVWRRYSEFVWLANYLGDLSTLGCEVPELPPKRMFFRFESTFIETRRKGLERFLTLLVQEPRFLSQRAVHLFLQSRLSTDEIERLLGSGSPAQSFEADSTLSPTVLQCDLEANVVDFQPPILTSTAPPDTITPKPQRPAVSRSSAGTVKSF